METKYHDPVGYIGLAVWILLIIGGFMLHPIVGILATLIPFLWLAS